MSVDRLERGLLDKPAPWDWQPASTIRPDLLAGICTLIPFWEGAGSGLAVPAPYELLTGTRASTTTAMAWSAGDRGPMVDLPLTSALRWNHADYWARPTTAITVLVRMNGYLATSDGLGAALIKKGGATGTFSMQQGSATAGRLIGRLRVGAADLDTGILASSPGSNTSYVLVLRWQSTQVSNLRLYRGTSGVGSGWQVAVEASSASPATGTLTWANEILYVGHEVGNLNLASRIDLVAVWSRRLTDGELAALIVDPHVLVRPALPLPLVVRYGKQAVRGAQADQRTATVAAGLHLAARAQLSTQRTTTTAAGAKLAPTRAAQLQLRAVTQAAGQRVLLATGPAAVAQRATTQAPGGRLAVAAGQLPQRTTTTAGIRKTALAVAVATQRTTTTATTVAKLAAPPAAVAQRATTQATGRKLDADPAALAQRVTTAAGAQRLATQAAQADQRTSTVVGAGPAIRRGPAQLGQRVATTAVSGRRALGSGQVTQRNFTRSSNIPSRGALVAQRTTDLAGGRKTGTQPAQLQLRTTTVATGARVAQATTAALAQRSSTTAAGRKLAALQVARLDQHSATVAGALGKLAIHPARVHQRTSSRALALAPPPGRPARLDQRLVTVAAGGLPPGRPPVVIELAGREPGCEDLAGPEAAPALAGARRGQPLAGRRGTLPVGGSRPASTLDGKEQGR